MNDLNRLAVPVNAPGDYGVHDPQNAWPGAGADVRVSMNFVGPNLIQFGYTVGTEEVWTRRRKASGEEPWSEWVQAGSGAPPVEPPASGITGARGTFEDDTEQVVLPDYIKLNCLSVIGPAAVLEGGDLRIKMEGTAEIEFRATITHEVGGYAILGLGWDGAAPEELTRVQINSASPGFVIGRTTKVLAMDSLLALYLSSDVDSEDFAWSGVECQIVKWE